VVFEIGAPLYFPDVPDFDGTVISARYNLCFLRIEFDHPDAGVMLADDAALVLAEAFADLGQLDLNREKRT
jgi:hypothetical protein